MTGLLVMLGFFALNLVFGIFGALSGLDRARCAIAFTDLVKAASAQLDEASRAELNTLLLELSASPAVSTRQITTQSQPS
jgi:hypothetical protein